LFSVFAVSKGVPAAATMIYGKPGIVRFEVTGFEGGGKNCSRSVVAMNSSYEDFHQCVRYFTGMQPEIGRSIEVRGMLSNWGIVRERVEVRR
jgi:predicted ATP-dependent Lon-type protease